MSRKRTTYSAEFKAKVVLEILEGEKTLNEIASKYDLLPKCKKRTKPATLRVCIRPPLSLDIRQPVAEMIRPLLEKERDFIFV